MIGSPSDIVIADLVHGAIASMRDGHPGRFGDRKAFISAIWDAMCATSDDRWIPHNRVWRAGQSTALGRASLDDFKHWLVSALRLTDASGRPLVVLARADMVAAMDTAVVASSQIETDGAQYHFVVDRQVGAELYAPPRKPTTVIGLPAARGRVGGGR